jgi:UDP-N-acetylmuramate--alanine ligase
VVNADCPAAMQAARSASCQVITIGNGPAVDWRITTTQATRSGWSFVVEHRGRHVGRFRLPSPVSHNLTNALAAIALGHHLGIPPHHLQAGIKSFAGVRRRFERLGESNGVTWIDDYAHHPTAIRGVLTTVRQRFGSSRVWCAFQPHQVSRTRALLQEFSDSLAWAHEVLIPPVFAAREQADEAASHWSRELAKQTARRGVNARFVASLDEIRQTVETEARPGDVFLTLGAGDIDSIPRDFSARLARQRAS